MCCDDEERLDLPAPVIEALARYRELVDERGWDWGGEDLPDFFRWARFSRLGDVMGAVGPTGDWAGAIREVADAAGDDPGLVRLDVAEDGAVALRPGPRRLAIPGRVTPVDLVVDSRAATEVTVAGLRVPAGGAAVTAVDVDGADPVLPGVGRAVDVVEAAELTLRADDWSRWSVTDPTGGAWFPDGVPRKWDGAHRPFFHAREVTLRVPAVELDVACTRGPEFAPAHAVVDPRSEPVHHAAPRRVVDPVAEGWHSGDLHVHLNYSGDLVLVPADAERMQRGEGLGLLDLTAGNLGGPRVYDRELLEHTVGRDLWRDGRHVARASVEFRNDLLGHVHALGLDSAPDRYQTGHEGTAHPHDHPPNAVACADLRARDGSVAYAHPVFAVAESGEHADRGATGRDEDDVEAMFAIARMPEARELVADAAVGLVDSVDLVHCWDPRPTAALYHRLLGCGLRPAATAGSDVFLSFAHGPGVASNPPGWGRVYADLDRAPLSVAAFRAAVRAGRTTATSGPFVTLTVDGHGPGAVLDGPRGRTLLARVRSRGALDGVLRLLGPDGVVAETAAHGEAADLAVEVTVDGPLWLAASAEGGPHPMAPEMPVFAHSTPVHVEVDGARTARAADARWCLAFLDRFERHLHEHGRFDDDPDRRAVQVADHTALLARARAFYASIADGRQSRQGR